MTFKTLLEEAKLHPQFHGFGMFMEFCEVVLAEMEKQKITRAELARRMGVSRAYVSKLFKGCNMTVDSMAKVALALGYGIKINPTLEKL